MPRPFGSFAPVGHRRPFALVAMLMLLVVGGAVAPSGGVAGSPNETCATAADLGIVSGTFTGTISATTTNDVTIPAPCILTLYGGEDGPDLVWKFTLPSGTFGADMLVEIDTLGSTIGGGDTKLAVFTGCDATLVACNDDLSATVFLSRVSFVAQRDVEYTVVVEGFRATDTGDVTVNYFVLPVPPPSDNDLCSGARVISQLPYADTVDTRFNSDTLTNSASAGWGGGGSPDAYWRFTPDANITPVLFVTGFDTAYGIYEGACGALVEVDALDDFWGGERGTVTLAQGTTYTILAEGFTADDTGLLSLAMGFPSDNDTCEGARVIESIPFSDTVNTIFNSSTRDNSASVFYGGGGGFDAYWSFTPAATVTTTVSVTGFDTAFAVYVNDCGSLSEVFALDAYIGPESAELTFTGGVTYTIMCEGYRQSDYGELTLTLGSAPANDTCATAQAIADPDFPVVATLAGASRTVDAGGNSGVDVWYDVTVAMTGTYTFVLEPLDAGHDLVLFTFDHQDCGTYGGAQIFNAGGPGIEETTGTRELTAGDRFSLGVAGLTASDVGEFRLRLKYTEPGGIPILAFGEVDLGATSWQFLPGDGQAAGTSSSSRLGGLLSILMPAPAPTTWIPIRTGIWSYSAYPGFMATSGMLYAVRSEMAVNFLQDPGDQKRIRAEPFFGAVDHSFIINETTNHPFAIPAGMTKQYLAYFESHPLDLAENNTLVFDAVDTGNAFGTDHIATLVKLEIAAGDPAAFLGSPNQLADLVTFGDWTYVNYGPAQFGPLLIADGGTPGTANGRLQHVDDDGMVGGAAEWSFETPDAVETRAGGLYMAAWRVATDDFGDGHWPRMRLLPRSIDPAVAIAYEVRGGNYAINASQPSPYNTFNTWWSGHDFAGFPGAGNPQDDILFAFGLANFDGAGFDRDGMLDLHGITISEIAADDPNLN